MRVLYDIDIPIIGEYLSLHNIESQPFVGRSLTNDFLRSYKPDALFIRSTTKVNETLLEGVTVSFIATATSGTDHIDGSYTNKEDIITVSAKGSNANAVAEYIISSLLELSHERNINLKQKKIGIIGYGNVGQRVAEYAKGLGLYVLVNDPPRKENGCIFNHDNADLNELLSESDIITFHVPFIDKDSFATKLLLNEERILLLKQNAIIINAARGNVIDEERLLQSQKSKNFTFIIDTWANEPQVSLPFLKQCYINTPHIAGYTLNSKRNAAYAVLSQWLKYQNKQDKEIPDTHYDISEPGKRIELTPQSEYLLKNSDELLHKLRATREIISKSQKFRNSFPRDQDLAPQYFDQMRKDSVDNEETLTPIVKE